MIGLLLLSGFILVSGRLQAVRRWQLRTNCHRPSEPIHAIRDRRMQALRVGVAASDPIESEALAEHLLDVRRVFQGAVRSLQS